MTIMRNRRLKLFSMGLILIVVPSCLLTLQLVDAWNTSANSFPRMTATRTRTTTTTTLWSASTPCNRAQFLQNSVAGLVISGGLVLTTSPTMAAAETTTTTTTTSPADLLLRNKQLNLSNQELKEIVLKDVVENQFLTNGQLTRSIYDESATFTDEIDTYTMDKWILGTQKLFVGDGSHVKLVGDVQVNPEQVEFRFDEDLMFNIPFVRPVVSLTGRVVLKRSPETGLITSYQEFWDQDVATVLKSAKL